MSIKKSWLGRLGSHPHLANIKEIPRSMRERHGEDFAKKPSGTR